MANSHKQIQKIRAEEDDGYSDDSLFNMGLQENLWVKN